jgi:sigma-E factor negative regulatory protein RseC
MTHPQGTIIEIIRDSRGARAIVDVQAEAVCARCAAGRGCGAGVFGAGRGKQRLDVVVDESLDLAVGDAVSVELAPGNVLVAALVVYGLPLAGAAVAAFLAYGLGLGDGGAALMAFGGLCAGALAGRRRLQRAGCLASFTPTLSRAIAPDA